MAVEVTLTASHFLLKSMTEMTEIYFNQLKPTASPALLQGKCGGGGLLDGLDRS